MNILGTKKGKSKVKKTKKKITGKRNPRKQKRGY